MSSTPTIGRRESGSIWGKMPEGGVRTVQLCHVVISCLSRSLHRDLSVAVGVSSLVINHRPYFSQQSRSEGNLGMYREAVSWCNIKSAIVLHPPYHHRSPPASAWHSRIDMLIHHVKLRHGAADIRGLTAATCGEVMPYIHPHHLLHFHRPPPRTCLWF